jgi:hypothetical protein
VSWFARIEASCAAFIERTFAKTFPSDLEPAQIARKLIATMEGATRGGEGAALAPSTYDVFVNHDDYARLLPHQKYLEEHWADLLEDMAARVNVSFDERVGVRMHARDDIPQGAVEIDYGGAQSARAPDERRLQLRMVRGVPADGVYSLAAASSVGRGDGSDVMLADPSVSRRHAAIEIEGHRAFVRDLQSKNGTFVNGERVERSPLSEGDEVRFGKTIMRVEAEGA